MVQLLSCRGIYRLEMLQLQVVLSEVVRLEQLELVLYIQKLAFH